MAGRNTKLTKEVLVKLMNGIKLGLTYKDAAQFAGISESTFYVWKEKAEKAKSGKFLEFMESLKKANVEAQVINLKKIHDAAGGGKEYTELKEVENTETGKILERHKTTKRSTQGWQAAAWLLERRFPELWGRKDRVPETEKTKDPFEKWVNDLQDASAKFDV